MGQKLWDPPAELVENALMTKYMRSLGRGFESYEELHRWSVEELEAFWASIWDHFGVTGGYRWVIDDVFSIGPEAGFVDLGETKSKEFIEQPGLMTESARVSVKNKAALLGVNAKWMLGHAWSVGARAGLTHTWIRAEAHVEGQVYVPPYAGSFATSSKYSSHDNGYYGAVNVGYDFTRHTGVSVGYEYYHNEYHALGGDFDAPTIRQNIGVWAASFEYRF